jgi:hypothetical protein
MFTLIEERAAGPVGGATFYESPLAESSKLNPDHRDQIITGCRSSKHAQR